MKENINFFWNSINSKNEKLNDLKPEGTIIIKQEGNNKELELETKNKELLELITTYKILKKQNNSLITNEIIEKIINIIKHTKNINFSPFCVYFQVLNYSYFSFLNDLKNNFELAKNTLEKILNLYIRNRHNLYMWNGYTSSMLQVVCDNFAVKRKSIMGINMIIDQLNEVKIKKIDSYEEVKLFNSWYILPDKGDKNLFLKLKNDLELEIDSYSKNQNKLPDLFIKVNNEYFILESKIINNFGGSQNHSISEIINFINQKEKNDHIHYISCLDGNYFDNYKKDENSNNKQNNQVKNIIENLNKFVNNYFIKHNLFKKIIDKYNK